MTHPLRALAGLGALACAAGAGGCGPEVRDYAREGVTIHHLLVGIGNVWALETERGLVLVDLSQKGDADNILSALDKIHKAPADVTLVVLTHGHLDHAGPGARMQKALPNAPFAIGAGDVQMVEDGFSDPPKSQIIEGDLARPFLDPHFPGFTPDIVLQGGERLDAFGVAARVVAVPGHTAGSMAVVLDTGDAFVGDIIRGVAEGSVPSEDGHGGIAGTHLYSADLDADRDHLDEILTLGAKTFFPGHGPYFGDDSVRGWIADHTLSGGPPQTPGPTATRQ